MTCERPTGGDGGADGDQLGGEPKTSVADPKLVARADRVLRAALREGITGPDVELLLEWVAAHRVQQRKAKARAALASVVTEIREAS